MKIIPSSPKRRRLQHHSLLQLLDFWIAAPMAVVFVYNNLHFASCFVHHHHHVVNTIILPPRTIIDSFTTTANIVNFKHSFLPPLYANRKQGNKNKQNSSSSKQNNSSGGSGFGGGGATTSTTKAKTVKTTTTTTTKKRQVVDSDYSLFPALEPHVLETMIPAAAHEGQSMPAEIYQRLDQIYGLADFNYQTREKENNDALSNLISSSSSSSSSSLQQQQPLSSLESLLLVEDVEPITTTTTATHQALKLDLLPAWKDEDFQVLHVDPLVLKIQNFFTSEECDRYRAMSTTTTSTTANNANAASMQSRSPTVGKDAAARAQRTSTTWYHYYEHVPELMAKASRLLGLRNNNDNDIDISHWEEAQTVRYRPHEKFTWHLDALGPEQTAKGGAAAGQRIATLLVYLSDLAPEQGGATMFRDLKGPPPSGASSTTSSSNNHDDTAVIAVRLRVRPQKGSALLFFPAAGGIPNAPIDFRTLHCGQEVKSPTPSGNDNDTDADADSNDKWIAQLWLRQGQYTPTAPSKDNKHDAAAVQQAIAEYCATFGTVEE